MANIPDNRLIAATSLQEYFVDKSSGLPLSNGEVYFYKDTSRTTLKSVYQLTGDPTNVGGYTFVPLDNPVRLSSVGTFVDDNENNIAVYYFPYDGTPDNTQDTVELYYIVAVDSSNQMQFTRSAWPSIGDDIVEAESNNVYQNQISNSQFVDISFGPLNVASYTYAAGSFVFEIAPDWDLIFAATGAGVITVTRNSIEGDKSIATNPPYTLTVVPGLNLTALSLRQKLSDNPGIWSSAANGQGGYISGSILLGPNSQATMAYVPSTGPQTVILSENNTNPEPRVFNQTVQLPISTNTSAPSAGFASIFLIIPHAGAGTTFSSVQVVGLTNNQTSVPYIQETAKRQLDHLFNYYKNLLQYKPIKSYLTGWDFPLNPAQFGTTGVINGAVNKSNYAWDQTIIYTSASTGVSYDVNTNTSGLRVTATTGSTQIALVQYLDQVAARALLNNNLSVNVSASTNNATGLIGTVSLWYTTAAQLPNANTTGGSPNQSIVASLDANGEVSSVFGAGWTRVSRNLIGSIPATFFLNNPTVAANYFDIALSGWGANITGANTATYFAIVVGFASLPATRYIDFNSISLVPGRIATIPAPQTLNETLKDCQYYYSQSYPSAAVARTATNLGELVVAATPSSTLVIDFIERAFYYRQGMLAPSFSVQFPAPMRVTPTVLIYPTFNGAGAINAGNVSMFYQLAGGPWVLTFVSVSAITYWDQVSTVGSLSTTSSFYRASGKVDIIQNINPAINAVQAFIAYQFIADARLGIVL